MVSLVRALRSLIARGGFERDVRQELAAQVEHPADDLVLLAAFSVA